MLSINTIIMMLSHMMNKVHIFYIYICHIWKTCKRRIGYIECNHCDLREKAIAGCNECSRYLGKDCVNDHKNKPFYSSHTVVEIEQYVYKNNTNDVYAFLRQWDIMKTQSPARTQTQPILSSNLVMMDIKQKFGTQGSNDSQLDSPSGFCLNKDGHIVVADTNNHCIKIIDNTGQLVKQFSIPDTASPQCWYPYKVVQMSDAFYVVCDEYMDYTRMWMFNNKGEVPCPPVYLNYIGKVAGLAINRHEDIVILDGHRCVIYCFDKYAYFKNWFRCDQLIKRASDLAILNDEYFVCDSDGHRIFVFNEIGRLLRVIADENIIKTPSAIDVSCNGNLLVASRNKNRFYVVMFSIYGKFINAFECPHTKVSNCFNIKIYQDGNLLIVDKKKHCVLECNPYSRSYFNSIISGMKELNGGPPPLTFF